MTRRCAVWRGRVRLCRTSGHVLAQEGAHFRTEGDCRAIVRRLLIVLPALRRAENERKKLEGTVRRAEQRAALRDGRFPIQLLSFLLSLGSEVSSNPSPTQWAGRVHDGKAAWHDSRRDEQCRRIGCFLPRCFGEGQDKKRASLRRPGQGGAASPLRRP